MIRVKNTLLPIYKNKQDIENCIIYNEVSYKLHNQIAGKNNKTKTKALKKSTSKTIQFYIY